MRIARIIEYFPPHIGGMERHGLILSQEQVKLGYRVDVFIGYGGDNANKSENIANAANCEFDISDSQYSHKISRLALYRMPLQFLPLYSKIRRLWFNFWAYNKVKKIHQKNPYNIIHIHGDFIEAYFGGKLSKKLGILAVITIHAGLNKRLLKPKNAQYFKNISKIICVSEEIAEDLESIGIPESKIEIISSGVYLVEFADADKNKISELRNQYGKPILISVGVLRVNKGFTYLVEAFRQIKEKIDSATLIIIGDGLERKNLEKQTVGIPGVYFLGRQEHDKVIEYLKAADIFVLASISTASDREGTPSSIMEAMAAGLPVVATRVGGSPYLIKDGVNGLLVNPKSSSELAGVITKLMEDSDLAQKMSEQNLEDIKQKDWPIITKTINEVYRALL